MDPNLPAQSPGQPPRDAGAAAPTRQRRATRESTLVDDDLVSCFMWASGEPGKEATRQASDGGERSLGAPADEYEGSHAAAAKVLMAAGANSKISDATGNNPTKEAMKNDDEMCIKALGIQRGKKPGAWKRSQSFT